MGGVNISPLLSTPEIPPVGQVRGCLARSHTGTRSGQHVHPQDLGEASLQGYLLIKHTTTIPSLHR